MFSSKFYIVLDKKSYLEHQKYLIDLVLIVLVKLSCELLKKELITD